MFRAFVCLLAVCAATLVHARNEGVTADEIRLGASVVLSGPLGPQTAQYGDCLLYTSPSPRDRG